MLFFSLIKCFSTSNSSGKTCLQRSKLLAFSKAIFHRNLTLIKNRVFGGSLKYSSLLLSNIVYLNYPDTELLKNVKFHIKQKIMELTPELTLELLDSFSMKQDIGDNGILEDIDKFVNNNFYKFSSQELRKIQDFYYLMDKKSSLSFHPILSDKINALKINLKLPLKETTDQFLSSAGLKFPKEMGILISNYRNQIHLTFKSTGQKLTLYGLQHLDKSEIIDMRKALYKQKHPMLYFFEKSPATYQKYLSLREKHDELNSNKPKKLIFNDLHFSSMIKGNTDPQKVLAQLGEMSFFDKKSLEFYVENFLLKNKEEYQLNEAENLLYISDWNLKKPDEISSLLYIIMRSKHPKAQDYSIVFADISLLEEIQHYCEKKSNDDLKKQVEMLRLIWLNELVSWMRKVNKIGCPSCSKNNRFGPNDIYNSLGNNDFDLSYRESAIAYKIMKALAMKQGQYEEAMGFYGSDHLLNIAIYMGKILEIDPQFFEKYKDFKGEFEDINRELIWKKVDFLGMLRNEEVMEELLSRWSLLTRAFTREK